MHSCADWLTCATLSPMSQPPRTATSVAAEVDMSPRTIKRWCRDGKIDTAGKLDGPTGAWLIGPEGVEQARRLADLTRQLASTHNVKSEVAA